MRYVAIVVITACGAVCAARLAHADPPAQAIDRPIDIVRRGRAAGGVYMMGFDAGVSQIAIVLEDDKGNRRTTRVESRVRRTAAGERESLLTILDPADLRGVTVLQREHTGREDELYLYLPAFRRTRQIAGNDKNGQFLGTDFTYVDMEDQEVEDARYDRLPDAMIDGAACYAVAVAPLARSMYAKQYARVEMWIRKDNYLAQQMKYYDHRGKLMKTYHLRKINLQSAAAPVVAEAQVTTERTGHSTYIIVESVDAAARSAPELFDIVLHGDRRHDGAHTP